MAPNATGAARAALTWAALAIAVAVPIVAAAYSPLLAWREPIYIAAGFAGIAAMALMLVQPLLVGGHLPGLRARRGRRGHHLTGGAIAMAVVLHVAGLWLTSPPDVIDALLFVSPTPFSAWGVIAMWAVFASVLLAAFRRHLRLRTWRLAHTALAAVIVTGSVVHAVLVDGTMEIASKIALCALLLLVTSKVMADLRVWAMRKRRDTAGAACKPGARD